MALVHGKAAAVLMGAYSLTPYLQNADTTVDIDIPDTTTFGNTTRQRDVVGLIDGKASMSGLWDGAAGACHELFISLVGNATASVLSIARNGWTVGNTVELLSVRQMSYKVTSPVDGVCAVSVETVGDGGVAFGVSLHALAAETSDSNSSSVDNAAGTSNGGIGHIHLTALSGSSTPTLNGKIQHSTDNSSWSDLITFTALTAVGSERKTVSGTVNRYTRSLWTMTGSSLSFTFQIGFART